MPEDLSTLAIELRELLPVLAEPKSLPEHYKERFDEVLRRGAAAIEIGAEGAGADAYRKVLNRTLEALRTRQSSRVVRKSEIAEKLRHLHKTGEWAKRAVNTL